SLDAVFDEQRLEVVTAIGDARGESVDTTAIGADTSAATPLAGDPLGVQEQEDTLPGDPTPDADVAIADSVGVPAEPDRLPGDSIPAVDPAALDLLARDWIRGDTIIGYFEPAEPDSMAADSAVADPTRPPADSLAGGDGGDPPPVEMRRLVALGSAQSLYRMTPRGREGNPDTGPNVNFL